MKAGNVFPVLVLFCVCKAHEDFFTSIGYMTDLLYTEKNLVTSLKDYIKAEELKLQQIKKWAEKLDELSETAVKDPEGFLGHPVNAFKLMKRLNTECQQLESLVMKDVSDVFISKLTHQRQNLPTDKDQTGAAKALFRLQDTYNLETNSLATGNLPGVKHKAVLTAEDCYDLGKVAFTEADYYHTELWMEQALRQLDAGEESPLDKVLVLDYFNYAAYQQGDLQKALVLAKRLLELDPEHQTGNSNLKYYEHTLAQEAKQTESPELKGDQNVTRKGRPNGHCPVTQAYEMLCRGQGVKMTPQRQKKLFCRYFDGNRSPILILSPAKQEEEWDKPHIIRYHDVISDAEIEKVKSLAKPKLKRAKVLHPEIPGGVDEHSRVAKSAWIHASEDPVIAKMNTRLQEITGLDVSTAEELQVANYGVGGQYEPHVDFAGKAVPDAFIKSGTGDRIATWLFYMSDVAAGGATVFTNIGAAVSPIKGSAVFWYNLFESGEGDYNTTHAACPVLVGNKWVSNKWFHERGQEFRRPCKLSELE